MDRHGDVSDRDFLPWYTLLEDWAEIIRAVLWDFVGLRALWNRLIPQPSWMQRPSRPFLARYNLWILLWDLSGLKTVSERIIAPPAEVERRPPSTFLLWAVGIYVALFGLTSNRYENAADRVQLSANAIVTLLASTDARHGAFPLVRAAQLETTPPKPALWPPWSPLVSLVGDGENYGKGVALLKDAVVAAIPASGESASRTIKLVSTDLSGRDVDLRGKDLSGAILTGANLSGAHLSDADLSGAILTGANLSGTILTGANLSDANLTFANLSRANLSDAALPDARLSGARLSGAILNGAILSDAILSDAVLSSANLSSANLSDADLSFADLSFANLSGADLSGIQYWWAIRSIEGAILRGPYENVPPRFLEWAREHGAGVRIGTPDVDAAPAD